MGKGTDKLYITHSEWASEDAYSASAGSGVSKSTVPGTSFKRLPFNFCAVSLQPFEHPVCTADGTIFDLTNILSWLEKHGTNPISGLPLKLNELIKLHFAKNDDGDMVDPVTFKVFTDNTHIVALKNTGNVFAWDTVERLNVKARMWRDLVSDEAFSRKDIMTLQDPQNVGSRDLSSFKYIQDGVGTLTGEQQKERNDSSRTVNTEALGNAARILKAKEAVARARKQRGEDLNNNPALPGSKALTVSRNATSTQTSSTHTTKQVPYNAAQHTTGKAAASFTSTGLTPHTSGERALLTDEEYMLKPRRVKIKGYARLHTSLGDVNIELQTEYAPRAVWNFVQLSKSGYYQNISFHRNIRNFMIQGGDPTGTGKGGSSIWGKNFPDEFDGPLTHDARGVVSMANKGKNTNSSQFFITYRPAKHLDRKHTIFGRVVGGMDTLGRMENARVEEGDGRPVEEIVIREVVVFVDPFEEFLRVRREREREEGERVEVGGEGGGRMRG
ncbi:MAG: peptidyl-prolyl cis-trans isomerase-like 2 [Lasallia pustulata]|uniref:Peptidyl-prolyl cis-trans isomerase-like 2 n=1 Tax=Lasallia pustulata TaxID=136370 RepID=A0A5M8PJ57_9LECA|nr:MAG: peptidyl-prolyl cis-trans isomerase-like 2 [Lasallia pustulata]